MSKIVQCDYCGATVHADWDDLWDYADMGPHKAWVIPLHSIPASGELCPGSGQEAK